MLSPVTHSLRAYAILQKDIGEQLISTQAQMADAPAVDLCSERSHPSVLVMIETSDIVGVVDVNAAGVINGCRCEIDMRRKPPSWLLCQFIDIDPVVEFGAKPCGQATLHRRVEQVPETLPHPIAKSFGYEAASLREERRPMCRHHLSSA